MFHNFLMSRKKGILMVISTKGFRKQREKFHLTMLHDTAAEVEGLKDLLTCPSRFARRLSIFLGIHLQSLFLLIVLLKQVNSSGVMPIIFSTSSLALPGTLARFTGIAALKKAALALNPGGKLPKVKLFEE